MITEITLENIASYKNKTVLTTDKKVNLLYGLNGTGKSTLSTYLYDTTNDKYSQCKLEGIDSNHEILVYNQAFIKDNFFESENLKGIFTLSKGNKDAEEIILKEQKEVEILEEEQRKKKDEEHKEITKRNKRQEEAKNKVWEIKANYSGGDRVLEFCLDGYKGSKDALFNHICGLKESTISPTKTIEELKLEIQSISGENAVKYEFLPYIEFDYGQIETNPILSKQIVGNENSTVARLIKELNNPDWVNAGLKYLPDGKTEGNAVCPFCQERTISQHLIENIKKYFDESYEADLTKLKYVLEIYSTAFQNIATQSFFEQNPKFEPFKLDFEIKYIALKDLIKENILRIDSKVKSPGIAVKLSESRQKLQELNDIIKQINESITKHNQNLDRKKELREGIKSSFWAIMQWEYRTTIASYSDAKKEAEKLLTELVSEITKIETSIKEKKILIAEQQKKVVTIDEAISNINAGLIDLGIDSFKIEKHQDNLYKIVREEESNQVFLSLSEGEKMIISFLYFIELCKGKTTSTASEKKKIVVIDDPISSLSHIFIFNIGRLIHNEFMKSTKYEQIFLLTHSLYFFYEMTDIKKETRKENQKLFRIRKNAQGSEIISMKYEEIQNDYHAYWHIIKDNQQPAALIANCMRNIIEYFFNFVEKSDLNCTFQKPKMKEERFKAFNRYINRESHSLGQNLFDIKEFDYDAFKEAFKLVFEITGYEAHYKKMMRN